MKNDDKKVARNFRLQKEINDALRFRSKLTGVTETRIIEDALQLWFEKGMTQQMQSNAARLAQWKSITLTRIRSGYSPSQSHLLPDGIKPVTGLLHGVQVGEKSKQLFPLSAVSRASERLL